MAKTQTTQVQRLYEPSEILAACEALGVNAEPKGDWVWTQLIADVPAEKISVLERIGFRTSQLHGRMYHKGLSATAEKTFGAFSV
jgi:hypothetical protein